MSWYSASYRKASVPLRGAEDEKLCWDGRSIASEVLGTPASKHRSSSHTHSPSPAGFTTEPVCAHHLPADKRQLVNVAAQLAAPESGETTTMDRPGGRKHESD